MNRERLLFVVVLAFVALWALVMREKPAPKSDAAAPPQTILLRRVASASYPTVVLRAPDRGNFTLQTNEREHPRPTLDPVDVRDLAGNWPPTARSVSVDRFGMLRRNTPAPKADEATIQLPVTMEDEAGEGAAKAVADRADTASLNGRPPEGVRVTGVRVGGKNINEPRKLPPAGLAALKSEFHKYAAMLEQDPQGAQNAGVTHVRVRLPIGGFVWKEFPAEIDTIVIAATGKDQPWWSGFKALARIPDGAGFGPRQAAGRQLLVAGRNQNNNVLLNWSLTVLEDARSKVNAQAALQGIYLLMMEAANLLNKQEQVLELAFDYLAQFPREERVLEYVGNILASRSFGLLEMAQDFFAQAAASQYAQRRRVEVLIRLGRFEEARSLLAGGRAGSGTQVDLLYARVALALGDFDTATTRANRHTGTAGEDGAEANQIMGGVAYAQGDAMTASDHFLKAAELDTKRSTAYSDLGLALAAQGRAADAELCFARAAKLDPIDNTVTPGLGRAFLKLAASEFGEAETMLSQLEESNPRDLTVRFFRAYAKERGGDLEGAATIYRSTLDDDHRYRVAIARLGLVRSRLVEASGSADGAKEAKAHLEKAVALNPSEPVLPYILGRFLMTMKLNRQQASGHFTEAEKLPAPEGDANLPLWAQAARAALDYRDDTIEERRIKASFSAVQDAVRDRMPGKSEKELLEHPVYKYAADCFAKIQENETKVDVDWEFTTFGTKPRDWKFNNRSPMSISVAGGKGVTFGGEVDYKGNNRSQGMIVYEFCSIQYEDAKALNGNSFYELIVEGEIPDNAKVDFGVGLVNKGRAKKGPTGIQIRRKSRSSTLEMKLDGGEHPDFKKLRGASYKEFTSVSWPSGKFTMHVKIWGGDAARDKGRFVVDFNGENIFEKQGHLIREGKDPNPTLPAERAAIFGRGRGNRGLTVYLWVEGPDGRQIPAIRVTKVVLTKRKK